MPETKDAVSCYYVAGDSNYAQSTSVKQYERMQYMKNTKEILAAGWTCRRPAAAGFSRDRLKEVRTTCVIK